MIKLLLLSAMLHSQPEQPIDTFKANILRVCEYDTVTLQNRRTKTEVSNCKYFEQNTVFEFKDSTIAVFPFGYSSAIVEVYEVEKSVLSAGLNTYYCKAKESNIVIYYYKPVDLVKIYFTDNDGETLIYFYLNQKN